MTRPKRSDAYPSALTVALQRVVDTGEPLVIPTDNPYGLRLTFYGLFGALRNEDRPELPALVGVWVSKDKKSLTLALRDTSSLAKDVEAALKGISPAAAQRSAAPPPPDEIDYEAAMARILGEKS